MNFPNDTNRLILIVVAIFHTLFIGTFLIRQRFKLPKPQGFRTYFAAYLFCVGFSSIIFSMLYFNFSLRQGSELLATKLFISCSLLCLVCAYSMFLLPKIFEHQSLIKLQNPIGKKSKIKNILARKDRLWGLFFLILSFPFEIWVDQFFASLLRSLILFQLLVRFGRIDRLPKQFSVPKYALWTFLWGLIFIEVLRSIWPHLDHQLTITSVLMALSSLAIFFVYNAKKPT